MQRPFFALLTVASLSLLIVACGGPDQDIVLDEGKADSLGNQVEEGICTFDWQCSEDNALVCRPWEIAGDVYEARCQKKGNHQTKEKEADLCEEDGDCLTNICYPFEGNYLSRLGSCITELEYNCFANALYCDLL